LPRRVGARCGAGESSNWPFLPDGPIEHACAPARSGARALLAHRPPSRARGGVARDPVATALIWRARAAVTLAGGERPGPTVTLPAIPGSRRVLARARHRVTDDLVTVTRAPTAPRSLYVCGITPYDATHLGHAATYVTFDLLGRALRDSRAAGALCPECHRRRRPACSSARPATDVDWTGVSLTAEIALFREDMTALGVLPPDELVVGVVESIDQSSLRGGARAARGREPPTSWPTRAAAPPGRLSGPHARIDDFTDRSATSPATEMMDGHRRSRRRPGPARASATRSTRCSGAPSAPGEPAWRSGGSARRTPRLAHRVHGHRPATASVCRSTSRAGASTWSSPTTTCRRPRPQALGERFAKAYRAPGHGRPRRREDEQVQGQPGARLRGCAPTVIDPMAIRLLLARPSV
jgi:hypothetical protein